MKVLKLGLLFFPYLSNSQLMMVMLIYFVLTKNLMMFNKLSFYCMNHGDLVISE